MDSDPALTTDPALVREAIGGSQRATERVWTAVEPRVRELVSRNIDDETEATEVFADVRLTFFEKLSTLRDPAAFPAWLSQVMRSKIVDRHRARRAEFDLTEAPRPREQRDAPTQAEGRLMEAERRRRHAQIVKLVWEEVAGLAPKDRQIIEVILRHDRTIRQASDELAISLSAAKMRFYRAIRRLDRRVRRRLMAKPELAEYYSAAPTERREPGGSRRL